VVRDITTHPRRERNGLPGVFASCLRCGSPAVTTGQLPLLLLHGPERRVVVLVDPLCGDVRCQTRVRQESLQLMSELRPYNGGQPLNTDSTRLHACLAL